MLGTRPAPPPLVSVIVPCYNTGRYLRETVKSVQAQSVSSWELVLVDDGSHDETWSIIQELAEQDPRVVPLTQMNGGTARARNAGFARSHPESELVAFLDSDDLWEPDALAVLLRALEEQPSCVGAHGLGRYIDSEGAPLVPGQLEALGRCRRWASGAKLRTAGPDTPTGFPMLAYSSIIATMGLVLLRRGAIDGEQPCDPAVAPCDDYDLWLNVSRRGDLAFVDRVVLGWRQHPDSVSRSWARMRRQHLRVLVKWLLWPRLSIRHRAQMVAAFPFQLVRLVRLLLGDLRRLLATHSTRARPA
jgi:glycosyltransferase involved in cell wall biosynthesis